MIWGMTLEPGKLYTEIMGEEVQLSMAAIDSRKDLDESSKSFCQIVMKTSKGEYVLCTLVHGVMFQQNLDLKLMPREKVTFSVQGPSVVYLVGYTASYPEDEELDNLEEEDIDAAEDSSAWESFDAEEESMMEQIKEEPLEIPDDEEETEQQLDQDIYKGEEDELLSVQQPQQQQETPAEMESTTQEEREEEIIFSVAELETGEMKTEAPTPKPAASPTASQMPPPQDMYRIQTTTTGTALGEPAPNSDFFYPETQQQPDVPITPPVSFQPSNSSQDFHQQQQQQLLPSNDSFIPPQKSYVQRAPPAQHRQVVRQQMNTQRTYPPQRRQYGTNRNQPAGKTRTTPQQINIQQQQQVRNISNIPQSIPGTSQQDVPGPSTSGPSSRDDWSERSLRHGKASSVVAWEEWSQRSLTEVKFACKICGKGYDSFDKLKVHINYHQNAGRYKCGYCSKTFHSKGDTNRHERTHTGEKPYKCSYCGRRFTQIASLHKHVKHVHEEIE
ncbi:uncharacterized protein [Apostichopus japonicus]|uniref:uncharacterized protein n=1 Tax=Stichopus japonicus TaxID=307972 RepID=UPI003AB2A709